MREKIQNRYHLGGDIVDGKLYNDSLRFRRWFLPYITKKFGITQDDLRKKSRVKEIMKVRQLSAYFLWKYTAFTNAEIASFIGLTDHSSVNHHRNSFEDHCAVHSDAEQTKEAIEKDMFKAKKQGRIGAITTLPSRS
jgi:hypothetical protein